MLDQLDVFLGAETRPFLDQLMTVIKTEEYMHQGGISASDVTPTPSIHELSIPSAFADSATTGGPALTTVTAERGVHDDDTAPPVLASTTASVPTKDDHPHPRAVQQLPQNEVAAASSASQNSHSPVKAPPPSTDSSLSVGGGASSRRQRLSDKERGGSRSRSRSPIDRRNARDSRNRILHRNKSPPGSMQRRYDRRGKRLSPPWNAHNNASGGGYSRRGHSRSRSPSPGNYRKGSPASPNRTGESESAQHPRIGSQVERSSGGKSGQRCRDFEEKGYCMRGETCRWDHGVDPVVLEDINNSAALMTTIQQYNPTVPDMWNRNTQFPSGPRSLLGAQPPAQSGLAAPGQLMSGDYQQRMQFRPTGGIVPGVSRELIPVPVMMMDGHSSQLPDVGAGKRRFDDHQHQPSTMMDMPPNKRKPIQSRMGPRLGPGGGMGGANMGAIGVGGGINQQAGHNCSLELRKVPRGLNSIAHLNNHFSKFGKIVNIHVNYENDPEAAIITFSTHAEANVAYRSTEAVLNNRFIKVFWHSNKDSMDTNNMSKDESQHMGWKGGFQGNNNHNQYQLNNTINNNNNSTANVQNNRRMTGDHEMNDKTAALTTDGDGSHPNGATAQPQAVIATPPQHRLKTNNRMNRKKEQEEQVKAAVQLAHGLTKRKHELLQEYLKQMRSCLELIGRVDASDPQRAKLLQTVKELQERVDKLRKEIAAEQKVQIMNNSRAPPVRKTKEQQHKELLDMELELIAQQQEGNDTTQIQKRIYELQRSLGIRSASGFPRSGPMGSGTRMPAPNRLAPPGSTSVDRRPSTLFIAGFQMEDSDALLGHFKVSFHIVLSLILPDLFSRVPLLALWGNHEECAGQKYSVAHHLVRSSDAR